MNILLLLEWLLQDAEKHEKVLLRKVSIWQDPRQVLLDDLTALNHGRQVELPAGLPDEPEDLIQCLRGHFHDEVTLISRVLSEKKPDRFLYYRVSALENEIFDSMAYFYDLVPEFRLPFDRVGRKGVERYLQLNDALLQLARRVWPGQKNNFGRLLYFLYAGLGRLFVAREDIRHYWVVTCGEENYGVIDREARTVWSGRKEMCPGDLIFVHRTAPRKAITDLYRVAGNPFLDPYWGWDGFKVQMERVGQLPDIPFSDMRQDPVLKEWGVIRRQFQGVIAEPVPHRVYNQLLERVPLDLRARLGLEPEAVAVTGSARLFGSEAEFEEQVVEPLLRKLGL